MIPRWLQALDNAIIDFLRRRSLVLLRVALGIVFLWFGALKLFGVSPVADLVARTLFFLPPHPAMLGLGMVEVLIGLGLLTGWAIRVTLLLFVLQMLGTFSVVFIHPEVAFARGNPLLLTTTGEFVVKNLVLVAAGLAIVGAIPKAGSAEPLGRMLARRPAADIDKGSSDGE